MSEELKYNEPWILQRADPYVYRHTDGNYYFTASIPAYDRLVLRRSETLAGLKDAEEVTLWEKHKEGINRNEKSLLITHLAQLKRLLWPVVDTIQTLSFLQLLYFGLQE